MRLFFLYKNIKNEINQYKTTIRDKKNRKYYRNVSIYEQKRLYKRLTMCYNKSNISKRYELLVKPQNKGGNYE